MEVLSPHEGYEKVVHYGDHKARLRVDRFIVQAFMAGLWVAIYGHACTFISSLFYNPDDSIAADRFSKVAYGSLFPGAFVAVALTGTELFTGNTAVMSIYTLNSLRQKDFMQKLYSAISVLVFSLVGNYAGAAFGAYFISFLSKAFSTKTGQRFLFAMADHKINERFVSNLTLGIGCNMLVCLATWTTLIIADGAGKILGMWFTVAVFAMGGFEHIVANFYTLTLAVMLDSSRYSFGRVLVKNWIPVCIGNILAGVLFTGFVWWFTLSPLPGHHYSSVQRDSTESSSKECQPLRTNV